VKMRGEGGHGGAVSPHGVRAPPARPSSPSATAPPRPRGSGNPRPPVRPQAALIAESFDADARYTGAGLGYQLASVIAGGPAPLIAVALLARYHSSTSVSFYIIGCAVVFMAALVALLKTVQARYANAVDPLAEPARSAV